ncbi:MAG: 16S rRNA (cytosine(1402)-N(4))-methyltransferase RsmH [Candidatus Babeliaceae bacterium]|nr:16S rRNA (cytosine(1402)-N(4))-methyltransferase RsmH [Candidatus Babeliaceae bacterium]
MYHISVMPQEAISYLAIKPHGVYVDCTFGGGGHSRAILQADPTVNVIAFDVDPEAFEHNREALEKEFPDRIRFIWANFVTLGLALKKIGIQGVDGILADFGTSMHQIHYKAGFSFLKDKKLDMRMSAAHGTLTAADIVNNASELELATIFWRYGEERFGKQIARAIVQARAREKITTTGQLADLIKKAALSNKSNVHPATRVFQALRIVVNHELEHIEGLLKQAPSILKPGGRMVCISFHSLEDRLVKQSFKEQSGILEIVTPKVIVPTAYEVAQNPSSRSAKLRAAQKI